MIYTILGTDMAKHFVDLAQLKSRLVSKEFEPTKEDKKFCLMMALHLSDISNTAKPWKICFQWI